MMQKRAETELLEAVGDYFHRATPGLGAALQRFKGSEWSGRREWGNRQRDKALAGMTYFDGVLQDRPFAAGDAFSMADITVFAGLMLADAACLPVPEAMPR